MVELQSTWARRHAIEQVMFAYYDTQLRFPDVAQMVFSGNSNARPSNNCDLNEGSGFGATLENIFNSEPLSNEAEAQNEAWRNMTKAIASQIAQIFYASRHFSTMEKYESETMIQISSHGDRAIATIVGRSWRSLKRLRHLFADHALADHVNNLIQEIADADAEIELLMSEQSENINA